MAKVVLVGLETSTANQIGRALASGNHEIETKPQNVRAEEIDADIVFADGAGKRYLPLLKNLKISRAWIPLVVVTRIPETSDWLDALEAGATDYCSAPFEARNMNWLMEAALPRLRSIAA